MTEIKVDLIWTNGNMNTGITESERELGVGYRTHITNKKWNISNNTRWILFLLVIEMCNEKFILSKWTMLKSSII